MNTQQSIDTQLSFEDIIPQLASLYRQDLLVPFLGSGMSRGVCCGWIQLLKNLIQNLRIDIPFEEQNDQFTSSQIIRIADDIVSALRAFPIEEQIEHYTNSLLDKPSSKKVPVASSALSTLDWPLVITTNYDDVYLNTESNLKHRPIVAGRSVEDCHKILRSLDEISAPMYWAIQGFVGGQIEKDVAKFIPSSAKRAELASQIVLGHQQYQKAINSTVHFRRSFAEVFRRRSLLFLGSGITEDYLVNLFSEILLHHGCGPHPHFALIHRKEANNYDRLFMQRSLGIVPIFYDDHQILPDYLTTLSSVVKYWIGNDAKKNESQKNPVIFQDEIGYKLAVNSEIGIAPLKVNIIKTTIPVPNRENNECSVVSVGRSKDNRPKIGTQAKSHLEQLQVEQFIKQIDPSHWQPVDVSPSYVFRYADHQIFAIAARSRASLPEYNDLKYDIRDLGDIPYAVCTALQVIEKEGFGTVHLGAIASGNSTKWPPIYPIAETLKGIRKFVKETTINNIKRINLYVIDSKPWSAISTRKIHVEALLTSDMSTHIIETTDASGGTEHYSISIKGNPKLNELLELCKIDRSRWDVTVYPLPRVGYKNELPDNFPITSTMRIILEPKKNV